jgi:hypothetical protein
VSAESSAEGGSKSFSAAFDSDDDFLFRAGGDVFANDPLADGTFFTRAPPPSPGRARITVDDGGGGGGGSAALAHPSSPGDALAPGSPSRPPAGDAALDAERQRSTALQRELVRPLRATRAERARRVRKRRAARRCAAHARRARCSSARRTCATHAKT